MHNHLSPATYDVGTNEDATAELEALFGICLFDNPKPTSLVRTLCKAVTYDQPDAKVLDFFAGSGTTAQSILELNAEDGGARQFILVQLDEVVPEDSKAKAAGFTTISELAQERIRRAGTKMLKSKCHSNWNRDVGFRVFKVDTSNMKDVYYRPDEMMQTDVLEMVNNVKEDRSAEDLLFQVLVDWGVDLTLPIRRETLQDKVVFFVEDNTLIACFESDITESLVKEIASYEPLRVVFRDNGFVSDAVKINVEQIFRQLSPITELKAL
jgi:adenine-specific DNA-methyltransferase